MVAFLQALDSATDPLNYAGALVAQDHGTIGFIPAVAEANVGMTNARGHDANKNLLVPWVVEFQKPDFKRLTWLPQDRRLDQQRLTSYHHSGVVSHRKTVSV